MTLDTILPAWQQLSTKIVSVLLGFLVLALMAIGATLFLSWQLEGSSAAINEAGSLRMQSYRLSMALSRWVNEPEQPDTRQFVTKELMRSRKPSQMASTGCGTCRKAAIS